MEIVSFAAINHEVPDARDESLESVQPLLMQPDQNKTLSRPSCAPI